MKTIMICSGVPGCGKSFWVKQHNLEDYVVSSDQIRRIYSTPKMKPDGSYTISQDKDRYVWQTLEQILTLRMKQGELIVFDATNTKAQTINKYKKLAKEYKYRVVIVDFSSVPLEVCLERNKNRPEIQRVPEEVIIRKYEEIKAMIMPGGVDVIPFDADPKNFIEQPIDLSSYKKVVHIGDIHGCYDTLMKYFDQNPFSKDIAYIFCGDYLDRGNQNVDTFWFINNLKNEPNVCLLKGNHERWIEAFGQGVEANSAEFNKNTKVQLEQANVTQSTASELARKFKQCSYYTFDDKTILACHGGIPCIPKGGLKLVAAEDLMKGVGSYPEGDIVEAAWENNYKNRDFYLIHGHRNVNHLPIKVNSKVFNLEGAVEFNGELRIVELDHEVGFKTIAIPTAETNKNLKIDYQEEKQSLKALSDEQIILTMRNSDLIKENKLSDYISSFNFTKDAFFDKNWNAQTTLARGLFINTEENKILARSYEKFFRLNEHPTTKLDALKNTLKFPLKAYYKYDGFLGIVSYDWKTDELFFASKTTNQSAHAGYLKDILINTGVKLDCLKDYLKRTNRTAVFEIIDPENDIHIIEYKHKEAILLDIINNSFEFKKQPYKALIAVGALINCGVKEIYSEEFKDFDELRKFLELLRAKKVMFNKNVIEGFVIEDSNGFMFKVKTLYYDYWKAIRNCTDYYIKHGTIYELSYLDQTKELFTRYLAFIQNNTEINFIEARHKFFEENKDLDPFYVDEFKIEFNNITENIV